jgi:hypothetical protein
LVQTTDWRAKQHKLGRRLQSALASVFSSLNLETVHLRGMVIGSSCQLLSLFSEAAALKELSLSRLYFTEEQWAERDLWPESQLWRPKLRSLLVNDFHNDSDPFCHYVAKPQFDLTRISTLTVVTRFPEGMNI